MRWHDESSLQSPMKNGADFLRGIIQFVITVLWYAVAE
jgi:hypothetical protein